MKKIYPVFWAVIFSVACQQPISPTDTALYKAAEKGDTARVEKLVKKGYDVNFVCTEQCSGWTPLMIAAAEGHADTVKFLLEKGANPNAQNGAGRSALHFAVNYEFEPIVDALLSYGANPLLESNDPVQAPRTPLQAALRAVQRDKGSADEKTAYNILKKLVYQTKQINSSFEDNTPLVQAFIHNDYDFAKYLLDHGANPYRLSTVKKDEFLFHEVEDYTSDNRLKELIQPYKAIQARISWKMLQEQGLPNLYRLKHGVDKYVRQHEDIPTSSQWLKDTGILVEGKWNADFTRNETPQFVYESKWTDLTKSYSVALVQYVGPYEIYRIHLWTYQTFRMKNEKDVKAFWDGSCRYEQESQLGKRMCEQWDKTHPEAFDRKENIHFSETSPFYFEDSPNYPKY